MLVDLRILMLLSLIIGIPKRFVVPRFLLVGIITMICKGYVGDITLTLVAYVIGLILGNNLRRFNSKRECKKNGTI